ncbi:MAG: hypothetical protein KAW17_11670 [Candidatus Eisenbacteria sp.]|nr:hypothetical protein [Candidatus Eisenbacteria bacterium]
MSMLRVESNLARKRGAVAALAVNLLVFLLPVQAAGTPVTARDLALGGAGTVSARGVETLWSNPANLGARNGPAFSLMFLSMAAGASNNSFTLDRYNRFTEPGTELSFSDKNEILESIPENQFQLRAEAAANALALTAGPIGFAVTPRVSGFLTLAKDYFDLLLTGNELNRTYSFDGTTGESIAFVETALSFGRRTSWVPFRNGRWGISLKLLSGRAYFEVMEAEGQLTTYPAKAAGQARVKVHYSGTTEEIGKDGESESEYKTSSGHGFGFDFGLAGRISSNWKTSIVVRDIGSSITWDRGTEKSYLYQVDSLTVENADEDDAITEEETDHPLDSFTVSIPATMHLELTRETSGFLFSTAYDQGFGNFAGVSTTPRLSFATEFRCPAWLPLRTGVSFGGGTGTCLSGGLGFQMGALRLDVAGRTHSIFPGGASKGAAGAFTSYLRF